MRAPLWLGRFSTGPWRRLSGPVRTLEQEREILKEAAAFFAKETESIR